jgi:poly(3-hydroxyalkanoate) depolymerase
MSTSPSSRSTRRSAAPATRFVVVDGLRLRVRVEGSGDPLLLVMGLGGNVEMWGPLVAAMDGRQTIAFDAPGTGESDLPRRPLGMGGLAGLVAKLLDELGYDRVDVLGVSFGGAVAQQLAIQHQERVRRLILAATTYGLGAIPGNPLTLAILLTPLRYYSRSYFELVSPYLYGRAGEDQRLVHQQALARLQRPPSLLGYYLQMAALTGWTSLPFLRRIRQPTLVMGGSDDRIVPMINARVLRRLIPDARLYVVDGGGHLFLLDRARESAEAITGFLDQAGKAGGST